MCLASRVLAGGQCGFPDESVGSQWVFGLVGRAQAMVVEAWWGDGWIPERERERAVWFHFGLIV